MKIIHKKIEYKIRYFSYSKRSKVYQYKIFIIKGRRIRSETVSIN